MISYKILTEKQTIIMCFDGKITPEIVISYIDELVKNPEYDPEHKSLVDLRNCDLTYDVEGMKRTLAHMLTAKGFAGKRKTAYITSNSAHVVPPMMMSSGAYNFPMEIKVLSTVASAIDWLEIEDFTEEDYKRILGTICDCH